VDAGVSDDPTFPRARWAAAAWLAVWLPAYWAFYGPAVFVNLCDVAVILTCVGLWRGSPLLLSSQAVSSLVVDTAWMVDLAWRAAAGRHLIGGTEYMWDVSWPAWLRALSLFHVLLPVTLLWGLRRTGYDRRAPRVQAAIAAAVLVGSRAMGPAQNVNFAFADPFFRREWGPAPVHLAVILGGLVLLYLATDRALRAFYLPPGGGPRAA
jgi:hypothetical protein